MQHDQHPNTAEHEVPLSWGTVSAPLMVNPRGFSAECNWDTINNEHREYAIE